MLCRIPCTSYQYQWRTPNTYAHYILVSESPRKTQYCQTLDGTMLYLHREETASLTSIMCVVFTWLRSLLAADRKISLRTFLLCCRERMSSHSQERQIGYQYLQVPYDAHTSADQRDTLSYKRERNYYTCDKLSTGHLDYFIPW